MEHKSAVNNYKVEESALSKHMKMEHPHEEPQFGCEIVGGSRKNLMRYIMEALEIEKNFSKGVKIMNNRGEWGRINLPRLMINDDK